MHRSDQELRTQIIDEMCYDPGIGASQITVSASNGAVTLSGEVANLAEKLTANRLAMRIRGVTAVADEMTVRNPGGNTDADLAEGANDMLSWAVDVPSDAVRVDVRNHVITLSGSVTSHYQRDAAARTVANMRGVTAVTNQIVLDHPESAPSHKAIAAALRRNASLDWRAIEADIDGHELVLRGTVRTFAESREAEQTVWNAAGVTSVRNELVVAS
jgi:osmotically-inducible protein OsmY